MFMSTVAPAGEKSQKEPDLDLRRSSSPEEDGTSQLCGFRNCGYFRAIKYPVILMHMSGIYVPSYCVCQKDVSRNSHLKNEAREYSDSDSNDANVRSLVYLDCVGDTCVSHTAQHQRCPNSDPSWLAIVKKLGFVLLMICHCTNTVRYAFIIHDATENEEALVFSLTTYFILTSFFYTTAFISHACYKYFTPYLSAVLKYDEKYGFKSNFKKYCRNNCILFCLVLIIQLVQSSVFVYGVITFFEGMKSQLWPFSYLKGVVQYLGALLVGVGVFFAGCNQYGINFFRATVTSILDDEFQRLEKEMASIMANNSENICTELLFDQLLEKFRCLCELMDKTYQVVKHTIAAGYLFGLPIMCFVLYGMIDGSIHLDQYVVMFINIITVSLIMFHTTISLAQLRTQISSVCDGVYTADWSKFSPQLLQKVTLFTNMFCTKRFGMSVYGVFGVDWSTLISLGGTLLTYTVVIIQFRVGTPTPVCHFTNLTV